MDIATFGRIYIQSKNKYYKITTHDPDIDINIPKFYIEDGDEILDIIKIYEPEYYKCNYKLTDDDIRSIIEFMSNRCDEISKDNRILTIWHGISLLYSFNFNNDSSTMSYEEAEDKYFGIPMPNYLLLK